MIHSYNIKTRKYCIKINNDVNKTIIIKSIHYSILNNTPNNNSDIIIDEANSTISFYADSVSNMSRVTYNNAIHMFYSLSEQQKYIESSHRHSFYKLMIQDIIVINDSIFLCTNPTYIKYITNGLIHFNCPFNKSKYDFCSPELLGIDKLPASISYKTFYYSLGAFICHCLFDSFDITDVQSITNTKLFWCLMRCLNNNINSRELLYL
jgi:hypothetical protein